MSTLIKAALVAVTLLVALSPAAAARFDRPIGLWYAPVHLDNPAVPARVYFDQMRRDGN